MQGVREVGIVPTPMRRHEPATLLRRLPKVVGRHNGRVGGIPGAQEFRAPLFNPPGEVVGVNAIRPVEDRVIWGKDRDRGIFLSDFFWSTRQLRRKRSLAIGDELLRVIQNDQMAAALGVLEKPVVMLMEIRSNCVGSRADDNRVQLIQCFGVEI